MFFFDWLDFYNEPPFKVVGMHEKQASWSLECDIGRRCCISRNGATNGYLKGQAEVRQDGPPTLLHLCNGSKRWACAYIRRPNDKWALQVIWARPTHSLVHDGPAQHLARLWPHVTDASLLRTRPAGKASWRPASNRSHRRSSGSKRRRSRRRRATEEEEKMRFRTALIIVPDCRNRVPLFPIQAHRFFSQHRAKPRRYSISMLMLYLCALRCCWCRFRRISWQVLSLGRKLNSSHFLWTICATAIQEWQWLVFLWNRVRHWWGYSPWTSSRRWLSPSFEKIIWWFWCFPSCNFFDRLLNCKEYEISWTLESCILCVGWCTYRHGTMFPLLLSTRDFHYFCCF